VNAPIFAFENHSVAGFFHVLFCGEKELPTLAYRYSDESNKQIRMNDIFCFKIFCIYFFLVQCSSFFLSFTSPSLIIISLCIQ